MRASSLYARCLGWGLATGAAAGGGLGAAIGLVAAAGGSGSGRAALPFWSFVAGLFYGLAVAVIPSALGAAAAVAVLVRRHPEPASYRAVRRDLAIVSTAVIGVLDLAVLIWWVALGGLRELAGPVAVLAAVNLVTAAVLIPARNSIARAWTGEAGERLTFERTFGLR